MRLNRLVLRLKGLIFYAFDYLTMLIYLWVIIVETRMASLPYERVCQLLFFYGLARMKTYQQRFFAVALNRKALFLEYRYNIVPHFIAYDAEIA